MSTEQRFKRDFRNRLVVDPYGTLNSEGKFVGRLQKPGLQFIQGLPGSPDLDKYPNLELAITGEVKRYFPPQNLSPWNILSRMR